MVCASVREDNPRASACAPCEIFDDKLLNIYVCAIRSDMGKSFKWDEASVKSNEIECGAFVRNGRLRWYARRDAVERTVVKHDEKSDRDNWAATWQNQQCGCALSEDSDQPGHPPSLIRVFAVRMKKACVLSYPLSAWRRLWSDWSDAQADLILRWAHTHFVGFVRSRLII